METQQFLSKKESTAILQDPRALKASKIAADISSNKKYLDPAEDLLLSKSRSVNITGLDLQTQKKKSRRSKQKLTERTRVDKAIESIKEVIEVSVGKPLTEESTVQVNDVAFVETKKLERLRTPNNQNAATAQTRNRRVNAPPRNMGTSSRPNQNRRTTTTTTPRRGGY